MNTPAHLIFGGVLFGKTHAPARTGAALLGGLMPDLSLYIMAGASLYLLNIPPQIVFGELYYSSAWQAIFAIDNSALLWGALLGLAYLRGWGLLFAFAGGGLLHIGFDFLLHHDDGRAHFWPLTNWVFQSPISYWDSAHFATYVIPIETGLAILGVAILVRRHPSWGWRGVFLSLLAMQLYASMHWFLMI